MKAREYDNVDEIRKHSETEVKTIQLKHQLEQAIKDRKRTEDEAFQIKDKLRVVLDEKINLENQLNHIERVEESRISELEQKFLIMSEEYTKLTEENKILKQRDIEQKKEIQMLSKGRDSFKEQFLELREINKDLK